MDNFFNNEPKTWKLIIRVSYINIHLEKKY